MSLSAYSFYLSLDNSTIPYLYFILILLLLIPFSFLVSLQLFKLIKSELSFNELKQTDNYSMDQLFNLLTILLKKQLWLNSIHLMESRKNIPSKNIHQYFNSIGYLYDSMDQYNLAIL